MARRSRGGHSRFNSRRENDPRRHIREMKAAFPDFVVKVGRDRVVSWQGTLQPNPSSRAYLVRVVYGRRGSPKVYVLSPALPRSAPHRYRNGRLCLYLPKEWRWTDGESLPDTIVRWVALWLEYFEIWQQVGKWLGPSSHATPTEAKNDD